MTEVRDTEGNSDNRTMVGITVSIKTSKQGNFLHHEAYVRSADY